MKPTIDLGESVGLGLIVALPTGVIYSNQTGAHRGANTKRDVPCAPSDGASPWRR